MSKLLTLFSFLIGFLSLTFFAKEAYAETSCDISGSNGKITLINNQIGTVSLPNYEVEYQFELDAKGSDYLNGKKIFLQTVSLRDGRNLDPAYSEMQEITSSIFSFKIDRSYPQYEKFNKVGGHEIAIHAVDPADESRASYLLCSLRYGVRQVEKPRNSLRSSSLCNPDIQGDLLETVSVYEECPSNTYCYVKDESSNNIQCHTQKKDHKPPDVQGTTELFIKNPGYNASDPRSTPITNDNPISFSAVGKGFGRYFFRVHALGSANDKSSLIVTVNSTSCIVSNQTKTLNQPKPTCTVLNNDEQTWQGDFTHSASLGDGEWEALITPVGVESAVGVGWYKSFVIGKKLVNTSGNELTVTVEPKEQLPLKNDQDNPVVIKWSPVKKGESYFITNNFNALTVIKDIKCDTDGECTKETSIPAFAPGGDIRYTVHQDGYPSKSGTSDPIHINTVVAPNFREASFYQCKINNKCASGAGATCDTKTGKELVTGDGILTAIGCVPTRPDRLVDGVMKYATFILGGIALLLMFIASWSWITAQGNPDAINKARDQFINAFIGLLFIIFSGLLLQIIGVDILDIPGLGPV